MSTHIIPIKVLAVLLSFVGLAGQSASADILITTEGSRLEGQVTKEGETYILVSASGDRAVFSKNNVRQVIKQKTEENPEVKKFRQALLRKTLSLKRKILAAKKEATNRQKRERYEATKPDKEAVKKAEAEVKDLRMRIYRFRSKLRGVIVHIPQKDGTTRTFNTAEDNKVMIRYKQMLAEAERDYREASRPREVPLELQLRHRRELEEYKGVERLAEETKKLFLKAIRAIQAVENQPDSLKIEMVKWEKEINKSIENAYDVLAKVRGGARMPEPIGFFTIAPSSGSGLSSGGKQNLVVVTRVCSESFMPSEKEYIRLRKEYSRSSSFPPRSRVRVFDSSRFKLILKDGRSLRAVRFIDPHKWGGNVIVNTAGWCIIHYRRNPPPNINIQIAWVLDAKDCTPPFRLQLDNFKPVSIPDKRLKLRPSREPSFGGASPRRSSRRSSGR